jgi:hypothetical protein
MNYAFEMRSGATIYISSFTKMGPGIERLIMGVCRHTDGKVIS